MIKNILFLFLLIVIVSSCSEENQVIINGNKIAVEIADEPQEHSLGLMHRKHLDENKGMLFIFNDEQIRNFWMKNTLIPLDMLFISKDSVIVDIIEAEPCRKDPCSLYPGKEPAKYVLEVNKGHSSQKNIRIGDKVTFKLTW